MYKKWKQDFYISWEDEQDPAIDFTFRLRYCDGRMVTSFDIYDTDHDYELKFMRRNDAYRVAKNLQNEYLVAGLDVPAMEIIWYSTIQKKIAFVENIKSDS